MPAVVAFSGTVNNFTTLKLPKEIELKIIMATPQRPDKKEGATCL
jgi:hypothetical protein